MASLKNPWRDGRDCAVLEEACACRSCLNIAENKGTFTQGVGYTSYYEKPQLVCMTRHCHGCPHPLPEPDPEKIRCCPNPDFVKPRNKFVRRQKCRTCGSWANGDILLMLKSLPKHPASKCNHEIVRLNDWIGEQYWRCTSCSCLFDSRPKPHEFGESHDLFFERKMNEWKKKMGLSSP